MEIVGRHALFFDDDANANFVNSKEALVEWNSLFIDRYDVRHLLSNPPASFKRLPQTSGSSPLPDPRMESELDVERYADLPSQASSDKPPELDAEEGQFNAGGYHAVTFSYGYNTDDVEHKNDDANSEGEGFCPPFTVPEHLMHSLPSSEKLHQIISRTALFVSQHGGQSEIVLRVKQGDNPTFGFLMPHHHLHPYFRYLVDHPEILNASYDGNSHKGNITDHKYESPGTGGALSLLGSAYGSVEDEDVVPKDSKEHASSNDMDSVDTAAAAGNLTNQRQLKESDVSKSLSRKHQSSSKVHRLSREKATNGVSGSDGKGDTVGSSSAEAKSSKLSVRSSTINSDLLAVDPPSELKRLVDRVIEIILKNGQGFEALLIEQDKNHGRFPFLLSSNQYHPYYKKMLRMAQKSRAVAKSFDVDAKTGQSTQSEESAVQDMPFDSDRKEKFKMVINKIKKDIHEQPAKEPQKPPIEISATAAAAILQAATRGIKKPDLDIFSKKSATEHPSAPVSVANEIAKTAAMAAAGEADSSEAGLTREQKLKAERLKRAKMFAAMIKGKSTQPPRDLSAEPPRSGPSSSGLEAAAKDREGSSAPADAGTSHKAKTSGKFLDNETDEKGSLSKRHYRAKNLEDEESDESRKKRRSHHSSRHDRDSSKERHKHRRRHSSSKERESRHRHHREHKHDSSSEDEYKRHKHKRRSSKKDARVDDDDDDRRKKHKKRSSSEVRGLEEGEISAKSSDQSLSNVVDDANKDKLLDRPRSTQQDERAPSEPPQITVVPDDLRAKIRAMLLATL